MKLVFGHVSLFPPGDKLSFPANVFLSLDCTVPPRNLEKPIEIPQKKAERAPLKSYPIVTNCCVSLQKAHAISADWHAQSK